MIEYSTVLRISDALPLSASTDDTIHQNLPNAKKIMKHFVQNLSDLPKRVCLQDDHFTIHCVHTNVVAFMIVCDPTFSHLIGFSFLDEISNEFNMLYTASVVAAVRRPYAFTEFDSYMQKLKQQINKPISPVILANRQNLSELRSELTLQPPATLNTSSILPAPTPIFRPPSSRNASSYTAVNISNGGPVHGRKSMDEGYVGVILHLTPLNPVAKFFILLAGFLMLLDVYRGIINLNERGYETENTIQHIHGICFLLECSALGVEIRLLTKYQKFRKLLTVLCVLIVALCTSIVLVIVREIWLSILYLFVAVTLAQFTFSRTFQKKKAKIHV